MKIFMTMNLTPAYAAALSSRFRPGMTSEQMFDIIWRDRPKAHIPIPPKGSGTEILLRNFRFEQVQRTWAHEKGMPKSASLEEIALAQIEESGAEILYNHNWVLMSKGFVARLPGCVRMTIAWHGAPAPNRNFTQYDLVLSNFPSLNALHAAQGAKRVAYFSPSHDPDAEQYIQDAVNRDIDVLFVGTYSRHHTQRARLIQAIATLDERHRVQLYLQNSRFTRLAETPLGWMGPLRKVRRPRQVRRIAKPPVFGHDLYRLIGRSKIVINMAINYAGNDRGNMRCFETLSCGACLVSDRGSYPPGFKDGVTFSGYDSVEHALEKIRILLEDPKQAIQLGQAGYNMLRKKYSKNAQWNQFLALL